MSVSVSVLVCMFLLDEVGHVARVVGHVRVHQEYKLPGAHFQAIHIGATEAHLTGSTDDNYLVFPEYRLQLLRNLECSVRTVVLHHYNLVFLFAVNLINNVHIETREALLFFI